MGRRLVVAVVVLALGAISGVASNAALEPVTVTPASGTPDTKFVVKFTTPQASGHFGVMERQYRVTAQDAAPGSGACQSSASVALPPEPAHARARVTLGPGLCPGRWHGTVAEETGPYCQAGQPCPEFATRLQTIGKFSFTVRPEPGPVPIHVTPSLGDPSTTFQIRFTSPDRTGRFGNMNHEYELSVTGDQGAQGCVSSVSTSLPPAPAHTTIRFELNPSDYGGQWCTGTFEGVINEMGRPVCPPRESCPLFVVLIRHVGRFQFKVSTGGEKTPPVFGGLKSATACTPGPQRPGQTTPYHLSWDAATDDATPSSDIVYDVYMSTTQGGEDFSSPNWTTEPGVTTFKTPGLPSHGTFYFVVRARDQAGNEDQNTVERRGVDRCF